MRYMVWLLCVLAGLTAAALPENHRPSHRPRLNRLMPSRTTAAPTTTSTTTTTTTTTAAPTEVAEASTATPVVSTAAPTEGHQQVDHQQISQQVLAQQHQQQVALDAIKSQPQQQAPSFRPFSSQYQNSHADTTDLQQLIALMQQHQGGGQYNIFSPPPFGPQASFAPSGSGGGSNFYNQQGGSFYSQPGSGFGQQGGGYSPQGGSFAPQGGGFSSQGYQQGGFSPQVGTGYGQQVYQPQPSYAPQQSNAQQYTFQGPSFGAPLPYNPPRTPTYIFKNGKYEIESNPDKIQFTQQPILAATPLPASEGGTSEVTQVAPPSSSTAEIHTPTAQPEQVGVQYVAPQQQEAVQQPIYAQPQHVFAQPQQQQYVQPQPQQQQYVQPQQQQYVQQPQQYVQPQQQQQQQVYVQQPQQYTQTQQQQYVPPQQQQYVQPQQHPQQSVVYSQAPPTFIQHVNRPESAEHSQQNVQQQVQPSSQPASYQEQPSTQAANPSSVTSSFSRLKYTPVNRG